MQPSEEDILAEIKAKMDELVSGKARPKVAESADKFLSELDSKKGDDRTRSHRSDRDRDRDRGDRKDRDRDRERKDRDR